MRLVNHVDRAALLDALADRAVNYDERDAPTAAAPGNWHRDNPRYVVAWEEPGPPAPDGPWALACAVVRDYEFADPRVIRAVYRADDPLLGRDMLLEGRFFGLRFYMGVRVTEVIEHDSHDERVWGWAYQTLDGHLEQGKLAYEVVKDVVHGWVWIRLRAYSRRAEIPNPVVRLGWGLFGRAMQLRFYREVGRRVCATVAAIRAGAEPPRPGRLADGLVMAPSGVYPHPGERLTVRSHHPGAEPGR